MRQIGVRDEAKNLGGCGRCGLALCCASWLREFAPVSIKMAKQQDLPLNPAEISGACGRLLCCLSYEDEYYGEARRHMPRINSTMMTPEGPGKVRQVHVLRNTVSVLVQGPNETKMFIEVPVPEADGQPAPGGAPCENCPGKLDAYELEAVDDEEDVADDLNQALADPALRSLVELDREPDSGDEPKAEGKPAREDEPGGQRRRGRSRRRGK
jgi:hypothetical protein